jgi:peptidoglycan/LPS O-acetylase OafA/YrhL
MSFFNLNAGKSRVFGLDLLRFFAILFVVFGHSMILVPSQYKKSLQIIVLDGVSIFFVLSGFLIGGILIKQLEKNKPSFKLLLNFWNRRWLRTLPMYLIVLSFLSIFTYVMKPERLPDQLWKYYLFVQNFFVTQPPFFSESWSLSVEEWFYLLIPSLIFTFLYLFKGSVKKAFLVVIIFVILLVTFYRLYAFQQVDIDSFREGSHFLMQVSTRLDSIMYGVLAVFISHYYPLVWQKFNSVFLMLSGVVLLYFLKMRMDYEFSVWVPTLKSVAVVLMLPYLSNWKQFNSPFNTWITNISLISYSMYLINLNVVIHVIIKFMINDNLLKRHQVESDWILEYGLFWVLTIGISFLLYKYVEVPFMNLRKREK